MNKLVAHMSIEEVNIWRNTESPNPIPTFFFE